MERANYKPLPFQKLKAGAGYFQPSTYRLVQVDSPAIEVMTDLQHVSAATTGPDVKLSQATQMMISRGVRLLLVVDSNNDILGLITARDTMGERPIKFIQENGGKHGDLKVCDCMTLLNTIEVLALSDVLRAEVGHIVTTLKNVGRQHAMVVDTDVLSGRESVRGIFSITQIGRQLGMSLQAFEVARTFAEIEAALSAR
ncbi:MAG: CBS domain-containing protein [Rhodocyclales bacterium]|nr:CBS domain-containing protein [Rhodocyclales bacterium]